MGKIREDPLRLAWLGTSPGSPGEAFRYDLGVLVEADGDGGFDGFAGVGIVSDY